MQTATEILSRYEENAKWLSKNYTRLKKKYKNEWVAVLNKTVIDHDPHLDRLIKRLRQKHPQTYSQIATEYITTKEIELIL